MPFAKKSVSSEGSKSEEPVVPKPVFDAIAERSLEHERNLSKGPSGKIVPPDPPGMPPAVSDIIRQHRISDYGAEIMLSPELQERSETPRKKLKIQAEASGPEAVLEPRPRNHSEKQENQSATAELSEPQRGRSEEHAPHVPKVSKSVRRIITPPQAQQQQERKQCFECSTTQTSTWRRDLHGNLICNKCGLRKRKDHHAPSRRLLDKMKDKHDSASKARAKPLEELSEPVVDPRPPRPWVNHGERKPSNSLDNSQTRIAMYGNGSADVPEPRQSEHLHAFGQRPALPDYMEAHEEKAVPFVEASTIRRRGPKKPVHPQTLVRKVCVSCKTESSPAWRRSAEGHSLCNRCMLRQKRADERKSRGARQQSDHTPIFSSSEHSSTPPIEHIQHMPTFHTNPSTAIDSQYRSESQIAYKQFTHLNSSFASDSGIPLPMNLGEAMTSVPSAHVQHVNFNPTQEHGDHRPSRPEDVQDSDIDPSLKSAQPHVVQDIDIDPELENNHTEAASHASSNLYDVSGQMPRAYENPRQDLISKGPEFPATWDNGHPSADTQALKSSNDMHEEGELTQRDEIVV